MKTMEVTATFVMHETIEVPDDWEWDGQLDSLEEYADLNRNVAELVDWDVQ